MDTLPLLELPKGKSMYFLPDERVNRSLRGPYSTNAGRILSGV
ncbi:MAG: hypothetical protein ACI9QL_004531, partial [Candidatus Omnitrophota bacterium]